MTLKVVRKITITYSGLVLSNTDPYSQLVFTSKRDRRSTRQIIRLLNFIFILNVKSALIVKVKDRTTICN